MTQHTVFRFSTPKAFIQRKIRWPSYNFHVWIRIWCKWFWGSLGPLVGSRGSGLVGNRGWNPLKLNHFMIKKMSWARQFPDTWSFDVRWQKLTILLSQVNSQNAYKCRILTACKISLKNHFAKTKWLLLWKYRKSDCVCHILPSPPPPPHQNSANNKP